MASTKTDNATRMNSISDTLTLGLVLVLVFGSLCLYLYTRIQQAEAKINLLEGLLLDIKMSSELTAYPDLQIPTPVVPSQQTLLRPFVDMNDEQQKVSVDVSDAQLSVTELTPLDSDVQAFDKAFDTVEELPNSSITPNASSVSPVSDPEQIGANYEAMTLKELQTLAKQRNLSGASSMRRAQIIQALRSSAQGSTEVTNTSS
jgi:hypothetical protein